MSIGKPGSGAGRRLGCWSALVLSTLVGAGAAAQEEAPLAGKIAVLAFFLDSTYTQDAGTVVVGATYSERRTPSGKEWEMPALYCTYGISSRIDASFSIPYSRGEYDDGFRSEGMGDRFLSIKVRVRDGDGARLGVAFEPTLEILGKASLSAGELGPGQYNVALPIIAQRYFGGLSVYGEAGYITRGALFAGLGGDAALFSRVGVGASVLYSRATSDSPLNAEFGLRRSRADALAGIYVVIGSRWTLLASAGRTLTALDANGTRRILNFGITHRFDVVRPRRRRR